MQDTASLLLYLCYVACSNLAADVLHCFCLWQRLVSLLPACFAFSKECQPQLACAGKSSCVRTKLSSLVRPFGHAKTLPLVVHTSGNTVYEEPCLAYLHLHITQVQYVCCSLFLVERVHYIIVPLLSNSSCCSACFGLEYLLHSSQLCYGACLL